jgi:hypothetical protein
MYAFNAQMFLQILDFLFIINNFLKIEQKLCGPTRTKKFQLVN